jgi:hypothetical protein
VDSRTVQIGAFRERQIRGASLTGERENRNSRCAKCAGPAPICGLTPVPPGSLGQAEGRRSPVPSLSRDPVHWLVMAEVIRASRCACSHYVSLRMMFMNLVALTGRSTISLPS